MTPRDSLQLQIDELRRNIDRVNQSLLSIMTVLDEHLNLIKSQAKILDKLTESPKHKKV